MSARDRAKAQHWDVDPTPPQERNQPGLVVAAEIRLWNKEAAKQAARWLKLAEDLRLKK